MTRDERHSPHMIHEETFDAREMSEAIRSMPRTEDERLRDALYATVVDAEVRDGAIYITGDLRKELSVRGLAVVPVQQGKEGHEAQHWFERCQRVSQERDALQRQIERLTSDAAVKAAGRAMMDVRAASPGGDPTEYLVLDMDPDFDDLPLDHTQGTEDDPITQEAVLKLAKAALAAAISMAGENPAA